MKVVLDTNVLISALLNPRGAPGRIFAAWQAGHFERKTGISRAQSDPGYTCDG